MIKKSYYRMGAALTAGMLMVDGTAHAATAQGGNNFSTIAGNVAGSISSLPGLISGIAYLLGTLIGVLGIMKIKDHVENPTQTPLKDGAIRLAAGGGLFALPIVFDAMLNTVGNDGNAVDVAQLNQVQLGLTNTN